ncbi:hypothetical protein EJ04DRAFT_586919 [Polyplosphaeria fusca]|uniref:Uncharacterized protein n=1 Tax=Polyplosphaeria fusca TaxID=682080 RepID=A0A9P4R7Y0_9PLEO|nr:hypothetical protein EJ04DRAFT_586919 [Polyplosphaeria fusca]
MSSDAIDEAIPQPTRKYHESILNPHVDSMDEVQRPPLTLSEELAQTLGDSARGSGQSPLEDYLSELTTEVESDASESGVTPQAAAKDEIASGKEPQDEGTTGANRLYEKHRLDELPAEAKLLCRIADGIIEDMEKVHSRVVILHDFIKARNDSKISLLDWGLYKDYRAMDHATFSLQKTVETFRIFKNRTPEVILSAFDAHYYKHRSIALSTSTSTKVEYAFNTTIPRVDMLDAELEKSLLTSEGQETAKEMVISELQKLINHLDKARVQVNDANDVLLNGLQRHVVFFKRKDVEHIPVTWKGWTQKNWQRAVRLCLSSCAWVIVVAICAMLLQNLLDGKLFTSTPRETAVKADPIVNPDSVVNPDPVVNLDPVVNPDPVANSDPLANTTTSFVSLDVFNDRFEHLEELYAAHGERIDNVWDSLGPPDEDGYYQYSNDKGQTTEEPRRSHQTELDQETKDIQQLRKQIHRVDLRLTRRLDRLQRKVGGR